MNDQLKFLDETLLSNGWGATVFPHSSLGELEQQVRRIAEALGVIRPSRKGGFLVDHLLPIERHQARRHSLSAICGIAAYPWHTDGAHWIVPPRFLVIACAKASPDAAATSVWDARHSASLSSREARTASFRVSNGRQSFYSTITSPLRPYYRYDPGCMFPLDDASKILQESIDREGEQFKSRIVWKAGMIAVIDNWRCLHQRERIDVDKERYLLRATVMES